LKRFHGWEPVTTYEFDEFGRVVSSRPEPEWDDAEQTVILALQAYKASLCPLCGGPLDVCTNPENELKFKGGLPIRCHATTARAVAMEPYKDQPNNQALMIAPILND
jgi:hypothetical protein